MDEQKQGFYGELSYLDMFGSCELGDYGRFSDSAVPTNGDATQMVVPFRHCYLGFIDTVIKHSCQYDRSDPFLRLLFELSRLLFELSRLLFELSRHCHKTQMVM